jgi:hypothetical protein
MDVGLGRVLMAEPEVDNRDVDFRLEQVMVRVIA